MSKILKILGKSVLCFVGLVICSWLLMQICDFLRNWVYINSPIAAMFKAATLTFTLPFLLTIAYTYILFRLFKREPYCYLIIALNGFFIFVLCFALWFCQVDSYILYLDIDMFKVGMSVIVLALMYKYLSVKRKTPKKVYGRAANAMLILMKFSACMCLLVILAVAGYEFMELRTPMFFRLFQEISFLNLMTAIVYSCVVYILFRRHKHIFWIIAVNSAVILFVWSLILLEILPVLISFSFVCFNTALIPPVLVFVFRSVEKRGNMENSYYKDSSAVGASSE